MPQARVLFAALVAAAALGAGIALAVAWGAGAFDRDAANPVRTTAAVTVPSGGAPSWAEGVYAGRIGGVVTVLGQTDNGVIPLGGGFVVDAKHGYVVTNSHVVTNSSDALATPSTVKPLDSIFVQRADGARVAASLKGFDLFDDVAVLKYDPASLPMPAVPLGDSEHLRVGEPVAAIGAPFGLVESLSVGVVSQIDRQIENPAALCFSTAEAIQTDAAVNPGNSGGPLFDAQGKVIGITSQIVYPDSEGADGANAGVAFAVPIEAVRRSMTQIERTGEAISSWLGVGVVTLTPDVVAQYQLRASYGVQVIYVDPRTGARRAGLSAGVALPVAVNGRSIHRDGDVITAVDGKPVHTLADMQRAVAPLPPGRKVRLTVYKAGKVRKTIAVTLTRRDPDDKNVCKATTRP
jgi:S1-C subfamily serine protease